MYRTCNKTISRICRYGLISNYSFCYYLLRLYLCTIMHGAPISASEHIGLTNFSDILAIEIYPIKYSLNLQDLNALPHQRVLFTGQRSVTHETKLICKRFQKTLFQGRIKLERLYRNSCGVVAYLLFFAHYFRSWKCPLRVQLWFKYQRKCHWCGILQLSTCKCMYYAARVSLTFVKTIYIHLLMCFVLSVYTNAIIIYS